MDMGSAPNWLRQVSHPASQNHFNHCLNLNTDSTSNMQRVALTARGLPSCKAKLH